MAQYPHDMRNMFKRRLPPRLRKIGFEIASVEQRTWVHQIDPIARHPITITFLAFVLSGVAGTWFSYQYQQMEREQDSLRRSMNEVRLALDQTNQAFADFFDAATVLEQDLTSETDAKQINQDKIAFWNARRGLFSKLALESPKLRQQMPVKSGVAFELGASYVRVGAAIIVDCFTDGHVIASVGAGLHGKRLECPHGDTFPVKYADERISRVERCVKEFYVAIRPDPIDDFRPQKQYAEIEHSVKNLDASCNEVTMLGIPYERAYSAPRK